MVAFAATGETLFSGYFKDVQRFDGAVVGTEYVTVPGEIDINAEQDMVTIILNNPEEIPFSVLEKGIFACCDYFFLSSSVASQYAQR